MILEKKQKKVTGCVLSRPVSSGLIVCFNFAQNKCLEKEVKSPAFQRSQSLEGVFCVLSFLLPFGIDFPTIRRLPEETSSLLLKRILFLSLKSGVLPPLFHILPLLPPPKSC
jgi:hypothetical protein